MARYPADRYVSARALAEDLKRFLQDRTILARRAGASERLWRWCKTEPFGCGTDGGGVRGDGDGDDGQHLASESGRARRVRREDGRAAADEREAESSAVLSFVENQIIAAARPEGQQGGLGRDVTLRQAIKARCPISPSFQHQPLIEARLRLALGKSFLLPW